MDKLQFKTTINAPKEKVWDILWNGDNYSKWTSVFAEGSTVQTDWKEGSKVLFLDGQGKGMVSSIAANKPNEYMSFKHLGIVDNGVEDTESEQVKEWAGAEENYTLKEANGKTELIIDLDINDTFKDYFENTFPKALEKVKELAEA